MSRETLLLCPFCKKPARDLGSGHCQCSGSNCISGNIKITYKLWNTRPDPWISVKDRLPEAIGTTKISDYVVIHSPDMVEWDVDRYDYSSNRFRVVRERITHWMPVPPLPKESEAVND